MFERLPLPDNHLTVDDFFIWAGLAMQFKHFLYPFTNPSLLPADRRDADLMLTAQTTFTSVVLSLTDNVYWSVDIRGMDSGL